MKIGPDRIDVWNAVVLPLCTCWRVERADGVKLYFTDFDRPVTITVLIDNEVGEETATYQPSSGYTRTAIQSNYDLSPDNADVEGILDSDAINPEDLRTGRYENAEVRVYGVEWEPPGSETEDAPFGASTILFLKRGWLGKTSISGSLYKAEWRGMAQAFSRRIGEAYSPNCRADLFDSRCKVDPGGTAPSSDPSVVNLAKAAWTIFAKESERSDHPAVNMIDANNTSFWSSINGQASWIIVDLGSPQSFDRIALTNRNDGENMGQPRDFEVLGSTLGTTFVSLGHFVGIRDLGGTHTYILPGGVATYRYVKINVTTSWHGDTNVVIAEMGLAIFIAGHTGGGTYRQSSSVGSVISQREFNASIAVPSDTFPHPNGTTYITDTWYDGGLVIWTSGQNIGRKMEAKHYDRATGTLTLFLPMPGEIVPGDTFDIYTGCDKTPVVCRLKFNNMVNIRCEPYLPGEDAMKQYPDVKTV